MPRVRVGPNIGCGLDLTIDVDVTYFDSGPESPGCPELKKENLESVTRLIDAFSATPENTVPREIVPDINEFNESGCKRIQCTSNPVFDFPAKKAVVKCILVKHGEGSDFFKALVLEVECVTSKCPSWVEVTGLFLRGNHLFMVMPKMLVMSDFAEAMHAQGEKMPSEVLGSMLYGWLQGLQALQERGLLHGDVKPANLVLGNHFLGKLSDFGSVGEHNTVAKYTKIHGLPPEVRCTIGFSLPRGIGDDFVNSKFDSLSIGFSALQIALGNKHPVFALSALANLPMEEKRPELMTTLLAHPDLLQSWENEGELEKIDAGPLRTVLELLTVADHNSRISPSQAVDLLPPSVENPEMVEAFVNIVLMPP